MCEHQSQVQAYHDGEMDPAAADAMREHLDHCAQCREELAQLRSISGFISDAVVAQMPPEMTFRLYEAWNLARERGMRRVAGWSTAVAAMLLIGALAVWPRVMQGAATKPGPWETAAVMPPVEVHGDGSNTELVQVAQWMASDLSDEDGR